MVEGTRHIKAIFFDWDGTLMDSAQPGLRAFQQMFRHFGVVLSADGYETVYSPDRYRMYEALGLSRASWQLADDLWIRYYWAGPGRLVEGARETLFELSRRGYHLGIVTSGSDSRVKREIEERELAEIFQVVICNEDTVCKKPHPEGLEKAMARTNMHSQCCSYIGDSREDIEMGKRARLLTVGVQSGYPGSKHLASASPDICLESVMQLLHYF